MEDEAHMSVYLGDLIAASLGGVFTNGLWLGAARDGVPVPYGVYQYFGSINNYLSGRASLQNREVQIDCYAATNTLAEALADSVEARMDAERVDASPSSFTSTPISRDVGPSDPVTKACRVVLRFSVWFRP
jgi:hypothetical protein